MAGTIQIRAAETGEGSRASERPTAGRTPHLARIALRAYTAPRRDLEAATN